MTHAVGATTPNRHDRVTGAIARAASSSGVDFGYLLGQARVESGLNPEARARTSSATGLYQFTRQTWLATLKRHGPEQGLDWAANAITTSANGWHSVQDPALRAAIFDLREDPDTASTMAAAFATDNADHLKGALGRELEPVDLYLAHFLGAGGAVKFLQAHAADPNAAAAPILPQAAQSNRPIFYAADGSPRSLEEIRSRFAARLSEQPVPVPAGQPERRSVVQQAQADRGAVGRAMVLREIEPMPRRLSLEFAQRSYQRLAALPAGTRS